MKPGWTEVALGEVVTSAERFEPPMPGKRYRQLGVRLWGEGAYERESIDGAETQYPVFNRCETGDLVLNKIWARNGSISVVPATLGGCFVSNEFPLFFATSSVSSAWLRWITKTPWFWNSCDDEAQGTSGKNRIKPSEFLKIRIPLPPLAEQQRIAAQLDAIESRLARVRQIRESQTETLRAALRSSFHRLVESAEWQPLAKVAPLAWRQIAINPDTSYTEFGVRSFYKGVFLRRKVLGSFFDWQELYRLKAGDIVFSNIMAWEKAIAVAGPEHDGWVGNHRMLICEPREDVILASCLLHYFMTEEGFAKILKASPGTAARNKTLKADRLMEIEVPVPPLAAQKEFQKLLALQTQVAARAAESQSATTALLPSLLDKIFN